MFARGSFVSHVTALRQFLVLARKKVDESEFVD
jgi:hypothetical protein